MKRRHSSARAMALFTYISVLILSLSACDEEGHSSKSGKLRLSLTADTTSLKKGIDSGITKAVSDEFAQFLTTEDYRILIVSDKDTTKSYDRFDQMPSEIELPEGAYTLVASKGNNLPAEFENPYFEGSTAFTVKEGMSTPLEVTATLGNARITAEYTDDFKEAYSEYTVLLSSSYTTADLEIAKGDTRPAYMQVDKDGTNIAIGIKLKKITEETEKTYYVPTALKLERRQNVRLVFKTDGEALDGIGLDIVLDDTMEEVTMTTEIPDFMWKPFKEPTLIPAKFKNGDELTVKTSTFTTDLSIGFGMPGGIGHLYVKYWPDTMDEEDATIFDLTTTEGVEAALEAHFNWNVEGIENSNLSKIRKTGALNLKDAIRNLKAPLEGTTLYTFHFYGTDATGKEQQTDPYPLVLKVNVQASSLPIVDFEGFPEMEIVEGEPLSKECVASVSMEGGINMNETKFVVLHDAVTQEYIFTDEGVSKLEADYGIKLDVQNTSATVTFPKQFTEGLTAKENSFTDYGFSFSLKDNNGQTSENQQPYTIKVNAPEFDFLTDDGAAFAKRIVLRTDIKNGNSKKLRFQYRVSGTGSWLNMESPSLIKEAQGSSIYKTTLTGLEPNTEYDLCVIYNDKYRKEKTVTTEDPVYYIPNAGFEEYSSEMVWEHTIVGSGGEKIYAFYPYAENSDEKWWNTRNRTTTQSSSGVASWYYCAFPGTVPIKESKYTASYHLNTYGGQSLNVSAFEGNNAMEIATVGWGANNWTSQSSAQDDVDYRLAGRLYIGDYGLSSHKESFGKRFDTRPSGIKFYYKFYSYNNETTKAYAQLWAEDGTSIGYGELKIGQPTNSYIEGIIPINYTVMEKAETMTIVFLSTDASQPTTLAIQGGEGSGVLGPVGNGYGDSRHIGSVLTVDNISLIYE